MAWVTNSASTTTTTITKERESWILTSSRSRYSSHSPCSRFITDILFLHGPTAKLNLLTLKLSAFFAFTALTSATCVMFHTLKLKAVVKPELFITRSQLRVSKILFGIAVVSLFSTCIFRSPIYSLLPKAYYFLPRFCIDPITPFWRLPLPLLSRGRHWF